MRTNPLNTTTDFVTLFDHLAGTQWTTPRKFYQWAAISLIAACVEDRVWVHVTHSPLYPNLWVFLIAEGGVGKDDAIGLALSLLRPGHPLCLVDGKVTAPALYDYMARQQAATGRPGAPAYLISSDLPEQLPAGPEALDFTSRALALYGGRDRVFNDITRTHGVREIHRPLLSWLAGCVPTWFPRAIDPLTFESGYAGRAYFIFGEAQDEHYDKMKPTMHPEAAAVRTYLEERIQMYLGLGGVFSYTKQGEERFHTLIHDKKIRIQETLLTDVEKVVLRRYKATIHKLAMVSALSAWREQYDPMKIRVEDVDRAQEWAVEVAKGAVAVSHLAHVTEASRVVDRVEEVLRTTGTIPRWRLMRIMRHRGITSRDHMNDVLEVLKQSGLIVVKPQGFSNKPGPRGELIQYVEKKRRVPLHVVSGPEVQQEPVEEPPAPVDEHPLDSDEA